MAMNAYLGGFGGKPIGTGNMTAYTLYLKYGQLSRTRSRTRSTCFSTNARTPSTGVTLSLT